MRRIGWARDRRTARAAAWFAVASSSAARLAATTTLSAVLSILAGCATAPPPPVATFAPPAPKPPAPSGLPAVALPPPPPNAFAALEGWTQDDHVEAFRAVAAACAVAARDWPMAQVCGRALRLTAPSDIEARVFLESNFRPQPLPASGLLTAYFTPVYEARGARQGDFTAPLRPRPADLAAQGAGPTAPYADRGRIESRPARDALAWMRPEDLFFLQIQGSGVLQIPGEPPMRAVFDGSNGLPFLGLAAPMRAAGLLPDADTSADAIHGWLAAHRGAEAQAVMRLDRRYVFFRLQPDDGGEPAGAAGLKLIPGRAVAVDPAQHAMGEVLWVDASAPALAGAFPVYRRLAMALDTGGAIKGQVRADLYLGRGPQAGEEAGRVRHVLRLYRLVPLAEPLAAVPPRSLAQAPPRPLS